MDSDGLIVFLFIIIVFGGIVAATLYDSHKERDNEYHEPADRSDTHETTKSTTSTATKTTTKTTTTTTSRTTAPTRTTTNYTRNNTEKNVMSSKSQKTIYVFREKKSIRLCPFCDGENELEAKVCNICRRDL